MRDYLSTSMRTSRFMSIFYMVLGLTGGSLAVIILMEKIALLKDPSHVTSCSFNPIVSCSPVMSSDQASAFFNIPNPIWGILGFAFIATFGFLSLFMSMPRYLCLVNTVGTLAALIFCFWLANQALFNIGALCIYCCGVWFVVTLLFWANISQLMKKTQYGAYRYVTVIGGFLTVVVFAVMVWSAFETFWLSLLR